MITPSPVRGIGVIKKWTFRLPGLKARLAQGSPWAAPFCAVFKGGASQGRTGEFYRKNRIDPSQGSLLYWVNDVGGEWIMNPMKPSERGMLINRSLNHRQEIGYHYDSGKEDRMDLREEALWRAMMNRDTRYNEIGFYGVLSTSIYCRFHCSSKKPRRENVRFFFSQEGTKKRCLQHPLRRQ